MRHGQRGGGRHATITDVARLAAVSIKTVSRVFNDEPNVRAETRERVRVAAGELDYHPNVAARSLAGRRSHLIAIAYSTPSPAYVVDLQMGAAARLADERYRMMVLPFISAAEAPTRMRGVVRAGGIDGMVLVPPLSDDAAAIAELEAAGLPFVRIAPSRGGSDAPEIAMDDRAATHEIIDHLVALGHRRIGLVRGHVDHASARARADGYFAALGGHGIVADPTLDVRGDYTFATGLEAGRQLLALADPPTAIFASNDDMAAGLLSAAHEAGVPVPARLSIAGFDDSMLAEMVWPRLTTIHQPIRDMAQAAIDALLALIEDRPTPTHVVLPHRLVVRGSTAKAAVGAAAKLGPSPAGAVSL